MNLFFFKQQQQTNEQKTKKPALAFTVNPLTVQHPIFLPVGPVTQSSLEGIVWTSHSKLQSP